MTTPDPLRHLHPADAFAPDIRAAWPALRHHLLSWHARQGRHYLPWKRPDPYAIWLSEIMLQQTQVNTVLRYFEPWLIRFPTITDLANASEEAVLQAWEGLGYYSRARNLHRAAQHMRDHHGGQMPDARVDRLALPGIGPSTASAIGAFAFGQREAIFDGNVRRVWGRWLADRLPEPLTHRKRDQWLWSFAQAVMPEASRASDWTQAVMDLGATVCTPRHPDCASCPLSSTCRAHLSGDPECFPPAVERPKIASWDLHWVWVLKNNRVAAIQRPTNGIWGRLWTLPETSLILSPPAAQGRHALTHRRLRWDIQRLPSVPAEAEVVWLSRKAWEAQAQPVPLRHWWASLSPEEKECWWAPVP